MTWREDLIKYSSKRATETLEDARMMFRGFYSKFNINGKPGD
jgi:hypothetical protein